MTTVPAPPPLSLEALLSRTWSIFRRNWIIALPPLIAMIAIMVALVVIVIVCVAAAIAHGNPDHWSGGFIATLVGAYLLFIVLVLAASLWSTIASYAMADGAWHRGTTSFGDGHGRVRRARGGGVRRGRRSLRIGDRGADPVPADARALVSRAAVRDDVRAPGGRRRRARRLRGDP